MRSGRWVYDGAVELPVDIVALEYDFWYEVAAADGTLEEGASPSPLGADGSLYYVRFRRAGDSEVPTWVDSQAFNSPAQAMHAAETRVPTTITWSHPSQGSKP